MGLDSMVFHFQNIDSLRSILWRVPLWLFCKSVNRSLWVGGGCFVFRTLIHGTIFMACPAGVFFCKSVNLSLCCCALDLCSPPSHCYGGRRESRKPHRGAVMVEIFHQHTPKEPQRGGIKKAYLGNEIPFLCSHLPGSGVGGL